MMEETYVLWDGDGPKTATEVVSQNSAMLRAMEKHQAGLRSAIVSVAKAILDSAGKPTDVKVTIIFDDSTTRDKAREAQEAWQWVQAGRFPFWEYLVRYQGYDEDEAKKADMTLTSEE